jgi:hypothetical protein
MNLEYGIQHCDAEFHDLEMKELEPTKGQIWVTFRPLDMPTRPRHIYVALKGEWGFVDLTFTRSLTRLFAPVVQPLLCDDMTLVQTGKSAAIRIRVLGFKVREPHEIAMPKVRLAFSACVRLIQFYRAHREVLNQLSAESFPLAPLVY